MKVAAMTLATFLIIPSALLGATSKLPTASESPAEAVSVATMETQRVKEAPKVPETPDARETPRTPVIPKVAVTPQPNRQVPENKPTGDSHNKTGKGWKDFWQEIMLTILASATSIMLAYFGSKKKDEGKKTTGGLLTGGGVILGVCAILALFTLFVLPRLPDRRSIENGPIIRQDIKGLLDNEERRRRLSDRYEAERRTLNDLEKQLQSFRGNSQAIQADLEKINLTVQELRVEKDRATVAFPTQSVLLDRYMALTTELTKTQSRLTGVESELQTVKSKATIMTSLSYMLTVLLALYVIMLFAWRYFRSRIPGMVKDLFDHYSRDNVNILREIRGEVREEVREEVRRQMDLGPNGRR